MAGPPAPVCLVCHSVLTEKAILDGLPPTMSLGQGWAILQHRILVECPACETVRVYFVQTVRLDEGDHVKRSLR
jgi:hypothetical protein